MSKIRKVWMVVGLALVGAAIATELRKPREEREWHGRIAGVIPYEFRPPTLERVRAALWNPEGERIFTDRVLGVGWSINFGRVARLAGVV